MEKHGVNTCNKSNISGTNLLPNKFICLTVNKRTQEHKPLVPGTLHKTINSSQYRPQFIAPTANGAQHTLTLRPRGSQFYFTIQIYPSRR